ncbi:unnamed protein product [Blepharisma stoltei]|uniref:TPX2 C-terminal domain-containing protein n=1 Tax=Blepharisma stoltei TaxID=1481888 RepID=A0AAU9JI23_9CILI|nr:unnamed protein product [Blepharisma stoltei]
MEFDSASYPQPKKRQFIPTFDSVFGDPKKRKNASGPQIVEQHSYYPLSWNKRNELEDIASSSSIERDNLINHALYNSQQPFHQIQPKPAKSTKPIPFTFHTDNRIRMPDPNEMKTREQRELEEIAQRPKFKARPVPKSLYAQNKIKLNPKIPTQPLDIKLHTAQRAKNENNEIYENNYQGFKALPLKKEILERPDFIPVKIPKKPTMPMEFELETAKRAAQSQNISFESDYSQADNKSRPIGSLNYSYQELPPYSKVQPFTLMTELRGQEKSQMFQYQVEKEREKQEKMTAFTAKPMPSFEAPSFTRYVPPPTVPEPFNLSINQKKPSSQNESEIGQKFYAREMPNFSDPFQPKPCEKPPTQPMDFNLHTDYRAEQRSYYDEQIREKEREKALRKQKEEMEARQREEEEIKALRKQMEFKAQPIWEDAFVPKIVEKKLTMPNPFHFQTELRAQIRDLSKSMDTSGYLSDMSTNFSFNQAWNN